MIAGRYALQDEIGRGGMGVVWRGHDEVLGRTVAIKRVGMSVGGASPDLRRAEREARLAARLNHPHVVAVFDLATDGDEQWLVMEFVEGRNLAQVVRDDGPLSPDQAAALLAQAADALAAAHGAGIVHRDVKPSNLLVTPTGQVKITDFGIARANADATLTQTGMVSGSPAYLAPEVAAGEPATTASDVWALGATLFHALEGRPPYETGGNVVGTLYQIVHEDPPRSTRAGWLAPLLAGTMAKDAARRWPMQQVLRTLRQGSAAQPEATRVLPYETATAATLPAVSPPADTSPATRTPVTPVSPAPRTAPRTATRTSTRTSTSRRGPVAWVITLLAILLLVVAAVLGWNLVSDGSSPAAHTPSAGPSGSSSSTQSPTRTPSTAPDPQDMETFVEDYLATVTSDPRAAWDQLTPGFQDASGGYGSYRSFWGGIESATVRDITADADAMTVRYDVTYTKKHGETVDDTVTLRLEQTGNGFLIAGEG